MKKYVVPFLIITIILSFSIIVSCNKDTQEQASTTSETTQKVPGKYYESQYLGTWYNADADGGYICTLNDDGTAVFKDDKKATWEETEAGITITTTVDKTQTKMEGYFVIAGEGYVARATDANMHYIDEGGTLQLEIMLTDTTCVDCVKK